MLTQIILLAVTAISAVVSIYFAFKSAQYRHEMEYQLSEHPTRQESGKTSARTEQE